MNKKSGEIFMPVENSYIKLNRASTKHMQELAMNLRDEQLHQYVNKEWTVYSTFAHLEFWNLGFMEMRLLMGDQNHERNVC
jgi:hypothetical protein